MSPQPFPTIFGGLAQGAETGMKLGLMKEEIETKKAKVAYDKELNTTRQELKTLDNYQKQANALPIEGRPAYWGSIIESGTISTPYGREVAKVYMESDAKTIKSIQTEQTIMNDAFRRGDMPTIEAHYPVLLGLLGKDSAAGTALTGTFQRFGTGKAMELVAKEMELKDWTESGKLKGTDFDDAVKMRNDVLGQIFSNSEAKTEWSKNLMKKHEAKFGAELGLAKTKEGAEFSSGLAENRAINAENRKEGRDKTTGVETNREVDRFVKGMNVIRARYGGKSPMEINTDPTTGRLISMKNPGDTSWIDDMKAKVAAGDPQAITDQQQYDFYNNRISGLLGAPGSAQATPPASGATPGDKNKRLPGESIPAYLKRTGQQ